MLFQLSKKQTRTGQGVEASARTPLPGFPWQLPGFPGFPGWEAVCVLSCVLTSAAIWEARCLLLCCFLRTAGLRLQGQVGVWKIGSHTRLYPFLFPPGFPISTT